MEKKIYKGRAPCCDKSKVNRGPWSPAEDFRLVNFIRRYGHSNWRALPEQAGLLRCGKSCRLRWINYLNPDVKRGNYTPQELQKIIDLHNLYGNKWSKIASRLPGRTDNEIKNVWNTHLKRRAAAEKLAPDSQKMEGSDSPSSASSTLTYTDTDKAPNHQKLQKLEVRKPNTNLQPKETANSDSPASCESNASYSNHDNAFMVNEDSGIQNLDMLDKENDSGGDFWEMLGSFDPLLPNGSGKYVKNQDFISPLDSEIDCGGWIKFMENGLDLATENDNLLNYHASNTTAQQNQEMGFGSEVISPMFDDFPQWPDFPGNHIF